MVRRMEFLKKNWVGNTVENVHKQRRQLGGGRGQKLVKIANG